VWSHAAEAPRVLTPVAGQHRPHPGIQEGLKQHT
jgi:hypothetical protein